MRLRRRTKLLIGVIAAALTVGIVTTTALAVTKPKYTLVWSDSFSGAKGALPGKAWSFETGGSGWGNQELECYTDAPGNVSTDGKGHLNITAIRQPGHVCSDGSYNDYTSARISTSKSFSVEHGRLEMRAKIPTAPGTWPAFWALGSNIDSVGWPKSGEIDVMEAAGKSTHQVLGSIHGPNASGQQWYITRTAKVAPNLSKGYHTYSVDWTSDSFTYAVDGTTYGTITRKDAANQGGKWAFDHKFSLLLNLAVGGQLPGTPPATTKFPQTYSIDYVRVYKLKS